MIIQNDAYVHIFTAIIGFGMGILAPVWIKTLMMFKWQSSIASIWWNVRNKKSTMIGSINRCIENSHNKTIMKNILIENQQYNVKQVLKLEEEKRKYTDIGNTEDKRRLDCIA